MEMEQASILDVLNEIREQTGLRFLYKKGVFDDFDRVDIEVEDEAVKELLDQLLRERGLECEIEEEVITFKEIVKPIPTKEAQEKKKIKGTITDDKGVPLPGVSVVIKGTNIGVATNIDGEYTLEFDQENAVFVFSFVGMLPQEITYTGQKVIDVTLGMDTEQMAEVVVTGYQTISKERATGSFSLISSKELETQISDNVLTKIKNVMPGVKVDNDNNIIIRGRGTLSGSTAPLVVIDGFPLEGDISSVNPDDVKSITVLKDAASASIWGAKAGNGVIVITTKTGNKKTKPSVSASYSFSLEEKPSFSDYNLMNAADMVDLDKEKMDKQWRTAYDDRLVYNRVEDLFWDKNHFGTLSPEQFEAELDLLRGNNAYKQFEDELLQLSKKHQFNLSVSGGSESMNYYNSLMYVNNQGSSVGDKDQRFVINSKLTFDLSEKLKVFANVNCEYGESENNGVDMNTMLGQKAYDPLYDSNGDEIRYFTSLNKEKSVAKEEAGYLPYTTSLLDYRKYNDKTGKNLSARAQVGLNLKLTKDLVFDSKFQYEAGFRKTRSYYDMMHPTQREFLNWLTLEDAEGNLTKQVPYAGRLATSNNRYYSWTFRNQLNFNKEIGDHRITAIAGFEVKKYVTDTESNTNYSYDDETLTSNNINHVGISTGQIRTWNNGSVGISPYSYNYFDDRNTSVYLNASYSFKNKYTFSASGRIDQSNLFGKSDEFKYNPIWSAGLSWLLSEEDFMQSDKIDMLKLRFTYGLNGNTNKTVYPVLTARPAWTNHGYPALYLASPANPELKWENNRTINLGIDYGLFGNVLSGSIELYRKKAVDIIGPRQINPTLGWSQANVNFASIMNKGVEFSLNAKILNKQDFKWNCNFSFTYNDNEVLEVEPRLDQAMNFTDPAVASGRSTFGHPIEGEDVARLYAYKWAGLDENGIAQVYDGEGNKVNTNTRPTGIDIVKKQGTTEAPYFGGLTNTFSYKNFSLTTIFSYQFGNVMRMPKGSLGGTYQTTALNERWQNAGDEQFTDVPAIQVNQRRNQGNYYDKYWTLADINVESAAFVKLRDIVLDYTFNPSFLKKYKISSLSMKLQLKNMWMWTNNSMDIDPERVNSDIVHYSWQHYNLPSAAQPRTVIIGLKATF
jgi:TonB-linked SusC/RagA family outer membrane protein